MGSWSQRVINRVSSMLPMNRSFRRAEFHEALESNYGDSQELVPPRFMGSRRGLLMLVLRCRNLIERECAEELRA